jgi:hypothetical protein
MLASAIQCNAWAQQNPLPAQGPRVLVGGASAPAGLNALGRLPARQRLNLAITLRLRNQEELRGLLEDIHNPSSAHYRQYLSVEEFTERFGPTAEDHERVLEFARSSGLAVTHTYANHLVVDVNGAVEDIERTFGVRMHLYRNPVERRTFYAPDVEPSVDASLPIQGVAGLSTLNLPHPASPRPVLSALPQIQPGGSASNGGFTGSDLRAAYIPGVTLTGAGQSVGLFEMNGYNISDIQAYFSSLGESLSVPIVNVLVDGVSGTCGVSCDDAEQTLDIEMAMALAPDLSAVIVYEGDTPADILNRMAADNLSKQLSCSYVFEPDPALYEPIFLEFGAQGQSFFASSGDGGAFSPPNCVSNCWSSLFPADDPYVTAVGGTELTTNGPGGAWVSETTWPFSGGGINSYGYPIASYQAPLINALNQGSSALRNIPDVAAVASNIFVEANGSSGSTGGTSASAPLWASFTALVNQQASGAPVGFLNPRIYPLALTAGYVNDFHDITSGNNFDSYSPDRFSAVTGYDLATGLGSPNGQNLMNALAPANTGANFTLLSSSPTLMVAQGAQGTAQITLQAVNGFNGTVNLGYVVVGQPTGLAASLSQLSISGAADSILTVSASTATSSPSAMVAITGTSGGLTQTIYLPVTVLLPNLVETSVSALPASVTPGATFYVTDNVQNSGQAAAGSSVTGYYLSDTTSKNALAFPLGSRTVPALAAAATSSATVTVTVPGGIWPNTPYYLLACANVTNAVAEATSGNCLASSTTAIYNLSKTATTTSLTLTSSGAPATSVASGALVTLTASVVEGSTPVHPGQVSFCDATPAHCTDIHLLGTAQLTLGGTATLRFIPGIGNHSYNAAFTGTTSYAASTSGNASLQVTGTHPTTTTMAESGGVGDYSLSATVTGVGGFVSPGGSLSFLDTSNSNASLGDVSLVAGPSSLGWLAMPSPATGDDPQGVAAADFNGDGIPDLAVANRNDYTVTIYLGNGDGTFRPSAVISNIYSAQAIAVADFNGDGIPDLAVTNSGWDSVTILLGKGNGTFTPPVAELSTGVLPAALAVADLNGDGIPDLAVANYADTVLSIFLGNGDGTFTTAPVVQLSATAQGVAAGDFNRDGRMDLAVAVAGPGTEMVEVLLGNGDGTFTPSPSTLSVGSYPSAIASADFDGDGIPDLAVAIAYSNTLAVFLGNGDGTFRPAAASPETGNYPLSLVAADFNGDGIPDLAVGNDGAATLTILLGKGDGTFTAASTNLATGSSPDSIAAADFNGDGFPDLAAANEGDNTASVFLTQLTWSATAAVNGVNPTGAGSHLVEASYGGDTNYSGSLSTTVPLATGPAIGLPAPPSFPSEAVGISSPAQSVTVTNTGGANLTFTAIGVTGPFAISPTGTTCSTSSPVAGPGTCTVAVTFTPTAAGAAPGSLSLTDNAPGSPQTLNWTATGLNPAPGITTLSPASATAGSGAQTLTINGTNFVSTSTVTYNGVAHSPGFVSPAQLTIPLSTGDQATAGLYAVVVTNPTPGGGTSNSVNFTVNNPVPTVGTLSPPSATAGAAAQTVTINGSGFVSSSTVTYNTVSHTPTFVSATKLTIPLSTGDQADAGQYAVVVTNPSPGGGASNSVNFTVNNPVPGISSLSPTSAAAGAAGQTLTINGTNFVSISTVTYNGVGHTAAYVSPSQITITLSTGDQASAGTYAVVVTNPSPGGGASNSVSFTVNNPVPSITTLSPTSATAGAAAETLTINGSNFVSTSTVTYNGVAHSASFVRATQLTIALTMGDQAMAGSYAVVVTNPAPGGGASNSVNLTVDNLAPTITTLSPTSATEGSAAQTLTINGTNFVSTSTVTYNGASQSATYVSATQLKITLSTSDQATAGQYAVVVTNPSPGGGASNSVKLTVDNLAPTITTLSPTSATEGAADQTLTINGTNFVSTSTVTYNGASHSATYVSATQLKITLSTSDQATAGNYAVVVTNPAPGGGASNSVKLTIDNLAPTITTLSPTSATEGAAAQTLTINGTNFVFTSTVTYHAVAHTATYLSATKITIPLTASDQATAGSYAVVVTNPAPGGGASNSVNFTVNNPKPTITTLSPSSATAGAAAETLTINGTNFVFTSTVTYHGVAHPAIHVSATKLTISLSTSDQARAGTYPVVVTNPAPGGGASNSVDFTVRSP